jgi:tetratricopeptide (TPR) repeat protein
MSKSLKITGIVIVIFIAIIVAGVYFLDKEEVEMGEEVEVQEKEEDLIQLPEDPGAVKEIAVESWEQRGDRVECLKAIQAFEKIATIEPGNDEILGRLSRAYYWAGINTSSREERGESYRKGIETGQKALKINPDNLEANYWTAVNMARLAELRWSPKSLGYVVKIRKMVQTIADADRNYYYGAVDRIQGMALTILSTDSRGIPSFTKKNAVEHLKNAVEIGPNYFLNHVSLAEAYLKSGESELARAELEWVINTPADIDPEVTPENRYEQKRAREILNKEF